MHLVVITYEYMKLIQAYAYSYFLMKHRHILKAHFPVAGVCHN